MTDHPTDLTDNIMDTATVVDIIIITQVTATQCIHQGGVAITHTLVTIYVTKCWRGKILVNGSQFAKFSLTKICLRNIDRGVSPIY